VTHEVQVQQERLDDGLPVMWRDLGERVRLAYDPDQISEGAAIAVVCGRLPHLMGHMKITHPA